MTPHPELWPGARACQRVFYADRPRLRRQIGGFPSHRAVSLVPGAATVASESRTTHTRCSGFTDRSRGGLGRQPLLACAGPGSRSSCSAGCCRRPASSRAAARARPRVGQSGASRARPGNRGRRFHVSAASWSAHGRDVGRSADPRRSRPRGRSPRRSDLRGHVAHVVLRVEASAAGSDASVRVHDRGVEQGGTRHRRNVLMRDYALVRIPVGADDPPARDVKLHADVVRRTPRRPRRRRCGRTGGTPR